MDKPADTMHEAERRVQTVCLLALSGIAAGAALYWLRPAMIPFVFAIFLTYAIAPVVDLLTIRCRLPRTLALFVAVLLGFAVFTALGALIYRSVQSLAENAAAYQQKLEDAGTQAAALLGRFGFEVKPETIERPLAGVPVGSILVNAANTVMETLSNTFLVLIFTVFLLLGRRHPQGNRPGMGAEIEARIRRYIGIKVALSGLTGAVVATLLALLDVELALVFGVLTFVLNFIPNVGSIIATLLPVPIVLISDASWLTVVLAVALPGTVQLTVGNAIEPKLMGGSLDLHPISILLSLILWGMLWGLTGMILAVPLTVTLKIFMEHLPMTRPVAELLAGRFGTPEEAAEG